MLSPNNELEGNLKVDLSSSAKETLEGGIVRKQYREDWIGGRRWMKVKEGVEGMSIEEDRQEETRR